MQEGARCLHIMVIPEHRRMGNLENACPLNDAASHSENYAEMPNA
jgi:hypothetical protein